ncbi:MULTISPECIES: aspartate--tRNA(Asn) ligase [unclassified Clostridium]|uniref:aspartate--tRNA(Asn) ligase n=1 Tax=unclassified Clostridium TaxID=2614128 RepID=UPI000E53A814|nr:MULTISPECIES: aspartate--tRNA(Asn) ligase [unclassified Clostridium]RHS83479.1 aspartate--tRNA(Asn) ligase [Clostridium sp. AM42-4]RHV90213.1 aspartate--tRNA(Asn) ligase [Clostridium sp. OF09-36]
MEFLTGVKEKETIGISEILSGDYVGKVVKMNGAVHNIRDMGEFAFVILRKAEGLVQCVYEERKTDFDLKELKEESAVEVTGVVTLEERAPQGFELRLTGIRVLSQPSEVMPIAINKWKMNTSLETRLSLRPVSLRNVRERAKFKVQEGIVRAFREFLSSQGFTEVHTPKIVSRGAEGGANVFKLNYFNKKAELGQSPQFYKQMMVGVFDRVFEVAPVFRAEKHNTTRHLNEYIGLDFEMGYIDSFEDVMAMETGFLKYTMELLKKDYKKELDMLDIDLPSITQIPQVRFDEAKQLVSEKYNRKIRNPFDLEPEEEVLIGRYFKEEYDSDFVFVTHYPSKKRPFYAMDDPADERFTLSFDLLYKGLEITTGGQRIHDYQMILEKMAKRGMDPEDIKDYLMIFKYGMPPHGGLGIGLERLTMRLLDEQNVRETSLFPRDVTRLEP